MSLLLVSPPTEFVATVTQSHLSFALSFIHLDLQCLGPPFSWRPGVSLLLVSPRTEFVATVTRSHLLLQDISKQSDRIAVDLQRPSWKAHMFTLFGCLSH